MSSRRRNKFSSNETDEHFISMMECLALESKAEIERLAERRKVAKLADAEKSGETILDLVVVDEVLGLGQRTLVTFHKRTESKPLPWHRLKVGSPVVVSDQDEPNRDSTTGVVSRFNRETIQVALSELPDGDRFRIDLTADEVTRQRQLEAITIAKDSRGRLGRLRSVLMGEVEPKYSEPAEVEFVTRLNETQQAAIKFALSAEDIAVIHGPPGTGKTTTVVELIIQAIRRGEKVLAVAPSNTGVDNLLERLIRARQKVVRIGHPARVAEVLRDFTLDGLVETHENMPIIRKMIREAEQTFRKSDKWTRAKRTRGEKQELRADAKLLLKEARFLEQRTIESILSRADVICGTTSFNEELLGERWFDLIVIDEACQSTEPGCWIPLLRGEKVILAGDHKQLPPTVLSSEAIQRGFTKSLMERQVEIHGESISRMLQIQYRMHEQIMQFSSSKFYGGALIADETVKEHLLADIPGVEPKEMNSKPFMFIDTAGSGSDDELEPDGFSKLNSGEANLVARLVRQLTESGVPPKDIGVIAPYAAQVRLLRRLIHQGETSPDPTSLSLESSISDSSKHQTATDQEKPVISLTEIEIDTVDGFQGREKEALIISLVVSNSKGEIGFLADERRMNVALTRARRKLIVIGDSATLGVNDFYRDFFEYAESIEGYQTIWEWQTP